MATRSGPPDDPRPASEGVGMQVGSASVPDAPGDVAGDRSDPTSTSARRASPDAGDPMPSGAGDDRVRRSPRSRRLAGGVAVLVLVAAGAWVLSSSPGDPGRLPTDRAPAAVAGLRWSLELASDVDPAVVVMSDADDELDDVVVATTGSDSSMRRRDGATGDEEWLVAAGPGEILVGVADGRLLGPVVEPQEPPTGIRAIDLVDGSTSWTRPANVETSVVAFDDAAMAVVDAARCSLVDPASGAATLTVGSTTAPCEALPTGLRWRDGERWLLSDSRGRIVARVPVRAGERDDATRRPWPVADDVVRLGATDDRGRHAVIVTSSTGEPVWEVVVTDGPRRVLPLGPDHVQVAGSTDTVLLDAATGAVTARLPAGILRVPAAADGGERLLAPEDGLGALEASGVWSRSPDAATLGLWGLDGRRTGRREVVVTSTPVGTVDGVVLAHGPDDARRVSLLSAEDLSTTWSVPTSLRFGQVVATSDELVVVTGDVDGTRRMDVLGG